MGPTRRDWDPCFLSNLSSDGCRQRFVRFRDSPGSFHPSAHGSSRRRGPPCRTHTREQPNRLSPPPISVRGELLGRKFLPAAVRDEVVVGFPWVDAAHTEGGVVACDRYQDSGLGPFGLPDVRSGCHESSCSTRRSPRWSDSSGSIPGGRRRRRGSRRPNQLRTHFVEHRPRDLGVANHYDAAVGPGAGNSERGSSWTVAAITVNLDILSLGFRLFGVAALRTAALSRPMDLLLIVPAVMWLGLLGYMAVRATPDLDFFVYVVSGVTGGHQVSSLGREPRARPDGCGQRFDVLTAPKRAVRALINRRQLPAAVSSRRPRGRHRPSP